LARAGSAGPGEEIRGQLVQKVRFRPGDGSLTGQYGPQVAAGAGLQGRDHLPAEPDPAVDGIGVHGVVEGTEAEAGADRGQVGPGGTDTVSAAKPVPSRSANPATTSASAALPARAP